MRFYADLNDLLAPSRRGHEFSAEVAPGTTVKDLVESMGVPHTEVDVIVVNGHPVRFVHRVGDGDRVSVYPLFEALDVAPISLCPHPLPPYRFVVDVHLGRLARYLRLLGFDAQWCNHASDGCLAALSLAGSRILLTRDRGLLKRRAVTNGYLVRNTSAPQQVLEVLRRFELTGAISPFARCLECNGLPDQVAKADVLPFLQPRTRSDFEDFWRCTDCGRVYWQGSHFDQLNDMVVEFRRQCRDDLAAEPDRGRPSS